MNFIKSLLFILLPCSAARAQVWTADQLIDTDVLYHRMIDSSRQKITIFNTGSVENIQGAIYIGPVENIKYLNVFKEQTKLIPKSFEIVIYCGCCPLSVCPNLAPAYAYLMEAGFENFKVLNIIEGIEEDWISKGYPLE